MGGEPEEDKKESEDVDDELEDLDKFPMNNDDLKKNFAYVRILLKYLTEEPDNAQVVDDILDFPEIDLNDIIANIPDKNKDLKDIHDKVTKKVFNNQVNKKLDDVIKSLDDFKPYKNIDTDKDKDDLDFDLEEEPKINGLLLEEADNIEKKIEVMRKQIDDIKVPDDKEEKKKHQE